MYDAHVGYGQAATSRSDFARQAPRIANSAESDVRNGEVADRFTTKDAKGTRERTETATDLVEPGSGWADGGEISAVRLGPVPPS